MKPDSTDVTLLLDRSGSMQSVQQETVSGVNNFIKEQASLDGECKLTLIQFDSENPQEIIQNAVPMKSAKLLTIETFAPRGQTPLIDAMATAIDTAGDRLSKIVEEDRPEHVVFVVVTDGLENASKKLTKEQLFEKVKLQTDTYGWKFVYLGANQDATAVGRDIGILMAGAANYDVQNTVEVYTAASANLRAVRERKSRTLDWSKKQRAGFVK